MTASNRRRFVRTVMTVAGAVISINALARGGQPAQQTAPPAAPTTGTGLILGQVLDAAGGGVGNALVTLSGGLVQSGSFTTAVSAAPVPGGPRRAFTNSD